MNDPDFPDENVQPRTVSTREVFLAGAAWQAEQPRTVSAEQVEHIVNAAVSFA